MPRRNAQAPLYRLVLGHATAWTGAHALTATQVLLWKGEREGGREGVKYSHEHARSHVRCMPVMSDPLTGSKPLTRAHLAGPGVDRRAYEVN